jgi:thiol-disulfide isomerase/thioredoxin
MKRLLIPLLCAFALSAADGPRRAPGFALFDSKMDIFDLADYRGKIVLLDFMQTTCPHCATFADVLSEIEKQYAGKVQILSVVKAPEDNSNTVAQYVAGHHVDYPVLFDTGQMAFSYLRTNVLAWPHVYLIDGSGYIRGDWLYSVTTRDIFEGKALSKEIDRVLGAGSPPAKKK